MERERLGRPSTAGVALKEKEPVAKSPWELKLEFLKRAEEEGAFDNISPTLSKGKWELRKRISQAYNNLDSTRGEDLKSRFGNITRQWVSILERDFTRHVWHNSSPELQEAYPLEMILSLRKPHKSELKRTTLCFQVKEQIEGGVLRPEAIAKELGISRTTVYTAINGLRNRGIDIPSKHLSDKKLKGKFTAIPNDENRNSAVDGVFKSIPKGSLRGHIVQDRKSENPFFVSLSSVLKRARISTASRKLDLYFNLIRYDPVTNKSGVPMAKIESRSRGKTAFYYILLAGEDEAKAIKFFNDLDISGENFRRKVDHGIQYSHIDKDRN